MATVKKLKAAAAITRNVPQNRDECAEMINQVGILSRMIAVTQAKMNDEIAAITDAYIGKITDYTDELKSMQADIQVFCEANRMVLTDNGKSKTGGFVTGTVQWRQRPPRVVVKGVDAVIDSLKNLQLTRFIREKLELNKEAILNEPTAVNNIPGLSIKSGEEEFVITPFEQVLS